MSRGFDKRYRMYTPDETALAPREPEDLHFCDHCRDAALVESRKRKVTVLPSKPCDLCLAQRRKRRAERLLEEGKPTLQHKPFEQLLAGKVAT